MKEIAVYIEGGGRTPVGKSELRQGFDALFREQKTNAGRKRLSLKFVCCGSRTDAYDAFINSINKNSTTISELLVDSETAVVAVSENHTAEAQARVAHLRQKEGADGGGQGDNWPLVNVNPERVHLMVQCMEAWIVSDPDALAAIYKQNFNAKSLPARRNLEEEPKDDIYSKLKAATEKTQAGEYAKIAHASKLLAAIDPKKVADRCPRFRIFREWLTESIGA